ncbi:GntR family transcriptional regulator [Streptococcus thoraltensis]|uniref:GntR family transcriptional regulator n=1 Tax=Streptococcus thoraltensis TaxID=55085 RepID=UPI001F5AFCBD|nr:GntR family transcriptional regulator [Streptococcus thoraltensis]
MVAKYRKIADDLRGKILGGLYEEGTSIPTEQMLQNDYQVSRHTVRQAISLLVNEGLLVSERGSGTFVAERANRVEEEHEKTITVGVLLTSLSDYIFPEIISGIEKTLRENNCSLILSSSNNDFEQEKECLLSLQNQGIDALIMEPAKSNCYNPNISEYLRIREAGIPLIFINSRIDLIDIPTVSLDDISSSQYLTEALFERNLEKIAIVTNWDFKQGKDRLEGFIKAHLQSDKLFSNEDVFCFNHSNRDIVINSVINYLERTAEVDALICYNDELAIDLIRLLTQTCPDLIERLTIASFDYSQLGKSYPIALSAEHPKYVLGEKVVQIILEKLKGTDDKEISTYLFQPKIIIK